MLADDLVGGVAEDPLGGLVPARDDAVEGLADDGIVGRFDDGREHLPRILGPPEATSAVRWARLLSRSEFSAAYFPLDVVEDEDDALDVAVVILDGGRAVGDGPTRPVLGREDRMIGEADHDALAEHPSDGILGRLARLLIRNEKDVLNRLSFASSRTHPVSVSATGFRKMTRPSPSVAMTASPMLRSVVDNQAARR